VTSIAPRRREMTGFETLDAIRRGELPGAPVGAILGMSLDEVDDGRVVFSVVARSEHENPLGTMHGGVLATLLDSAASCAVFSTLPPGASFTTLQLNVNYTRAVTTATGRVRAEGRVVHRGGRIATAEATVVDEEGAVYAHATTTILVIRPRPQGGAR
jgi:uncharacterized protein (TIGR00369 family)